MVPSRNDMVLPDPWIPLTMYQEGRAFATASLSANVLITSANDAVYMPVVFPCDAVVYAIRFVAANGTGNYDLGFYGPDLNRLASSGSTAMSAAGVKTLSFTSDIKVYGGIPYFAALALSSTSGSVYRFTGVGGSFQALRHGMEASALPLPTTATIVNTRRYAMPLFGFGVR